MSKRIRHHVNPLGILKEHSFVGFGNTRDIIVDIGAFKGEFIAELSALFPQYNYIALEVRARVAMQLRARFAMQENIRVFDGDGTRNLKNILLPSQQAGVFVREIYINFPDPWPKKRHKKRRIITQQFLEHAAQWCDPRTTWIFQTDRKDVFDDTVAILDNCQYAYIFFDTPPYGIRTDWEKAQVERGATIYRMRFWVGIPTDDTTSMPTRETFGERLIGTVAISILSVMHWLGGDDGH